MFVGPGHPMSHRFLLIAALLLLSTPAAAESITVESGMTLTKIAKRHGCTVKQLQEANDLTGSMIYAGQKLVVPRCDRDKSSKKISSSDGDVDPADYDLVPEKKSKSKKDKDKKAKKDKRESIGSPWDGNLKNGVKLPKGRGYFIRHPEKAYGTSYAVKQTVAAIKAVRKRFPRVHTLAIGDLSAETGGELAGHHSHQSGRDLDIGLYFKKKPEGYPDNFISHDSGKLDLAATWALVNAFARTADKKNGIKVIYLDYDLQGRLYEWAKEHSVPKSLLDKIFQYPTRGGEGLVRHEPYHDDHLHVRFKCSEKDSDCEN